jgi:hypothetical protein
MRGGKDHIARDQRSGAEIEPLSLDLQLEDPYVCELVRGVVGPTDDGTSRRCGQEQD